MVEMDKRGSLQNVTSHTGISGLAQHLKAQNQAGRSWRVIASQDYGSKRLATALSRISGGGYEPKDPKIRKRLGLPCYAQAPVCPQCGEVHVLPSDICTKNMVGVIKLVKPRNPNKKRLPIREWKPLALVVALELREELPLVPTEADGF